VGFETKFIQVLDFAFCNLEKLESTQITSYSGIVVTSPRAAQSLQKVPIGFFEGLSRICCIGQETKKSLEKNTGISALGSKVEFICGDNALALAVKITEIKDNIKGKPLLFLCGNLRRDELILQLQSQAIAIEELIVYETKGSNKELEEVLKSPQEPMWIVFFSPSGVQTFLKESETKPQLSLLISGEKNCKIAAIGPTTALEFQKIFGRSSDIVSEAPNATSLVSAIKNSSYFVQQ
jgi:uroporphyrinogen-III synthase